MSRRGRSYRCLFAISARWSIVVVCALATRPAAAIQVSSSAPAAARDFDAPSEIPAGLPGPRASAAVAPPAWSGSSLLGDSSLLVPRAAETPRVNGDPLAAAMISQPIGWPAPRAVLDAPSQVPAAPGPLPSTFTLAATPQVGESYFGDRYCADRCAQPIAPWAGDFSPDPIGGLPPYDGATEQWAYENKVCINEQRPWIEAGLCWLDNGQLPPPRNWFGCCNPAVPQLIVFGDVRTAAAVNRAGGDSTSLLAWEWNVDIDWKLTATERWHMALSPLDRPNANTRYLFDDDLFEDEFDARLDTAFFEGDMGALVGGWTGQTLPFDLPFAVGLMPMVFQNGVWMDDAMLAAAVTIPARTSAALDISNLDVTYFAAFDRIDSAAFAGQPSAARMYGVASFVEAWGGYVELDYAYLDDRDEVLDRNYHSVGLGFSRRTGAWLSNSLRVIGCAGQSSDGGPNTADGWAVLSENSLITAQPATFVPYTNLFVGFDRPQSAARDVQVGGILKNTGILFESDGMTGYPTLDGTAHGTYGGAIGINWLSQDFLQQIVLEAATVQIHSNDPSRAIQDEQYGVGMRYQRALSPSVLIRADTMYGFQSSADDLHGVRVELRKKY